MFRRRQLSKHHPDPATEQRLENIRQLRRQLKICEDQVSLYLDAIQNAQEGDGITQAHRRSNVIITSTMDQLYQVSSQRVAAAEAGIASQHDRMSALQAEIIKKMDEMNSADLAYL